MAEVTALNDAFVLEEEYGDREHSLDKVERILKLFFLELARLAYEWVADHVRSLGPFKLAWVTGDCSMIGAWRRG